MMDKKAIEEKILACMRNDSSFKDNGDGTFDYRVLPDGENMHLSDEELKRILESDNPKDDFMDAVADDETDYEFLYGMDGIKDAVRYMDGFGNEEKEWCRKHGDEFDDVINSILDKIIFRYNMEDYDVRLKVNLMLDTGDSQYDFAKNNVLNYYGNYAARLEEPSSILWLAKQQGKDGRLLKDMEEFYGGHTGSASGNSDDKFVDSVLQELENNSHCCACLTFLLDMSLLELIDFKDALAKNKIKEFTVSKDSECGLFAPFVGGGSVLEIQCDKDVVIPADYVWSIHVDGLQPGIISYDVNEVYGLVSSCWRGKLTWKEDGICSEEEETPKSES